MGLNPYSSIGPFGIGYHFHPGPNQIPYAPSSSLPPAFTEFTLCLHTLILPNTLVILQGWACSSLFVLQKEGEEGREGEGWREKRVETNLSKS